MYHFILVINMNQLMLLPAALRLDCLGTERIALLFLLCGRRTTPPAQDDEVTIGFKYACDLFGTNLPSDLGFSRGLLVNIAMPRRIELRNILSTLG
jgi:hypothetical protein